MYAIIEAGGKQYRVEPEMVLRVEKLSAEPGEAVAFDRVALIAEGGNVRIGAPWVPGAKVTCRVLRHGKGPKLDVFTFKAKENRKRSLGHRQPYTELRVEAIAAGRAE